ncbi:TolA domain-containing protein, partial [Bifidobacterium pullorum subsp. saeculare DSM 6531 = LMG 14934]
IGRDPIPCRKSFPRIPCGHLEHPALPPVSRSYSGAWGRLVTHYSPVRHSHPAQAPGIPFDLHVLSTPPAFILSQNRTLHKKPCEDIRTMTPNIIDETVYKENDPHKTPTPITGPSATPNKGAGIGLAIKMTLQSSTNTLLSSQTTTARPTRTTPAGRPAPTGSKGITYTNPATNANPTKPNTPKTLKNKPSTGVSQTPKNHHQNHRNHPHRHSVHLGNCLPSACRPPNTSRTCRHTGMTTRLRRHLNVCVARQRRQHAPVAAARRTCRYMETTTRHRESC